MMDNDRQSQDWQGQESQDQDRHDAAGAADEAQPQQAEPAQQTDSPQPETESQNAAQQGTWPGAGDDGSTQGVPTAGFEASTAGAQPTVEQDMPRQPIVGTIVWGAIWLIVAVVVLLIAIPTVSIDPTVMTIGAVITVGIVLVVAGITASVRRSHR